MTAYQTARRAERAQHVSDAFLVPSQERTFQAAKAQARAVSRLSSIDVTIRRSSSTSSLELSSFSTSATSPTAALLVEQILTPAQLDEQQRKEHEEDRITAQLELERYARESVTVAHGERVTDLVRYWEVCTFIT